MPSNTPNLNLTVYSTSDTSVKFLDYRTKTNGDTSSNMTKIDTFAGTTNQAIAELQQVKGVLYVPATKVSDNQYVSTITGFTGYNKDMIISLQLDVTNVGTTTLNINNLGNTSLMKKDSSGTLVNVDAGDLLAYKEYLFRYENTSWVILGAIPSDQVSVSGNNGDILNIQNGVIKSTGKKLGVANGIATTNADNKVVQVALNADSATNAQTANTATTVVDNAITDAKIGSRTIDDTIIPTNNTNTLNPLLNNLANRIKSITGESDWKSTSSTSLSNLLNRFSITTGHSHNGTDSKKIDYANIVNSPYIPQVIDDLTSTSSQNALSANQGNVLDNKITVLSSDAFKKHLEQPSDLSTPLSQGSYLTPTSGVTGLPNEWSQGRHTFLSNGIGTNNLYDLQFITSYNTQKLAYRSGLARDWKEIATQDEINNLLEAKPLGVSDLDLAKTIGFYQFVPTMINRPNNVGYGTLEISKISGLIIQEIVDEYGKIFTRSFNNNVWSKWIYQATTDKIDISLLNGWTYSFGTEYTPRCSISGNIVSFVGVITGGTLTKNTVLFTLPLGSRPPKNTISYIHKTNSNEMYNINILASGDVKIDSDNWTTGNYVINNTFTI